MNPARGRRALLVRAARLARPAVLGVAPPAAAALLAACSGARAPAPDVSYTLLAGQPGRLSELRGRVVLINFWATTCAVCVREMPELMGMWQRFAPRGFETLAVAMRHDPPARVAQFAQARALPFGVAIDNTGAIAKAFGNVQVTPTTFVVDKFGRIASRHVGAPDFKALARHLEELLAENGTAG